MASAMISYWNLKSESYPQFSALSTPRSCSGEIVELKLSCQYSGNKLVRVKYLGCNVNDVQLKAAKSANIEAGDSWNVSVDNDLYFKVILKLSERNIQPELYFESNVDGVLKKEVVPIELAVYNVTDNCAKIRISDACRDSVYLSFPFAGTVTNIELIKWVNGKQHLIKRITYFCCKEDNKIKVARKERGKFIMSLHACHTSYESEFEIN